MIYVNGIPFPSEESSSQDIKTLISLMEHPSLKSASSSLNSMSQRRLSASYDSGSQRCKLVYIFQKEYATVDPSLVQLVGTDEATTCVGLVIRNCKSGMTSVAHLDSPHVVEVGLTQMLALVAGQNLDDVLDVHLIGGYDDCSSQQVNRVPSRPEGFSFPLCAKIIQVLEKSQRKFHLVTLHVLGNNTSLDPDGNALPICSGFVVESSTGSVIPAIFDESTRCPDEVVRRIRLSASFEDQSLNGRLLDTYDTQSDQFVIAPCTWTFHQVRVAMMLQNLSDTEILLTCSTSPSAENADFVENERRKWEYLIQHPDWRDTFPGKQPRVFKRRADGTWTRLG